MEAIFLRARNALNDLNRDVGLSEQLNWPHVERSARAIRLRAAGKLARIGINLDPDILHFEWSAEQIRRFEALFYLREQKGIDDALYDDVDDQPTVPAVGTAAKTKHANDDSVHRKNVHDSNTTLVNVVDAVLAGPKIDSLNPMTGKTKEHLKVQSLPETGKKTSVQNTTAQSTSENQLQECQCCFNKVPPAEIKTCSTDKSHKVCTNCLSRLATTQLGLLRHELRCLCVNNFKERCDGIYLLSSLHHILQRPVLQNLLNLKQQDSITTADIDGLEKSAFCGYMEIYPPIDEEANGKTEFICKREGCKRSTCRKCRLQSHPTLSCALVANLNSQRGSKRKRTQSISRRHVEERMMEALVWVCPNKTCGVKIIKEDGSNFMTCSRYGHLGAKTGCETHVRRDEVEEVEKGKRRAVEETNKWKAYVQKT
ncbi:hypothetical protein KEM56_001840 [Ascosphaera pollenicola]|nr:hypothetical protein KEM56_001840 [Ascosphaera pollenicola]